MTKEQIVKEWYRGHSKQWLIEEQLYEVRPEICRVFKCDIPPEQAALKRDMIETKHKAQSMTALFFNDYTNQSFIEELFNGNYQDRNTFIM